jgi:hypothetical protein
MARIKFLSAITPHGNFDVLWAGNGWVSKVGDKEIINPYTNTLFTRKKSCIQVTRFWLKHGFYPKMKPRKKKALAK